MTDTILETDGLTTEFSGFVAVDGVACASAPGTIHALIGPNGAGKTTCFNLLTKFLQPTRGTIRFQGRDITGLRPAEVARLGLVRSFQISAVFAAPDRAGERAAGAAARARRQLRLLAQRGGAGALRRPGARAAGRCRAGRLRRHAGGQPFLWPQARAGDRHHARAGARDDAAGRADRRHGARATWTASSS